MTFNLGIITDLHADLGALQAALAHLDALGVDLVVCAGDIVDGGDEPEQVIALLREREIPCIRGNHDRWAVMRNDNHEPEHEGDQRKLKLRSETVAWLAALPTRWNRTIEGVRVAVRHGTPNSDMDGIYPDASDADLESWLRRAEADVLIAGHTHVPTQGAAPEWAAAEPCVSIGIRSRFGSRTWERDWASTLRPLLATPGLIIDHISAGGSSPPIAPRSDRRFEALEAGRAPSGRFESVRAAPV